MTTKEERSRGMAWLGTAASLGVVVEPALGGVLSPLLAAALLGLLTLLAACRWLPESMPTNVGAGHEPSDRCD